jgi:hypothetical protein
MRKQAEIPKDIDVSRPVEYTTYLPNQDKPFVIAGDYADVLPHVKPVEAVVAPKLAKTRNVAVAVVATEAATQPVHVSYKPRTLKQKLAEYRDDLYWQKVDKDLGINGTKDSIVLARRAQRIGARILVARQAARVDKAPVWGKHRIALAMAEKAIQER